MYRFRISPWAFVASTKQTFKYLQINVYCTTVKHYMHIPLNIASSIITLHCEKYNQLCTAREVIIRVKKRAQFCNWSAIAESLIERVWQCNGLKTRLLRGTPHRHTIYSQAFFVNFSEVLSTGHRLCCCALRKNNPTTCSTQRIFKRNDRRPAKRIGDCCFWQW